MKRPAADAQPYSPDDRKADSKRGRKDGRKRIPAFSDVMELLDDDVRVTTPYQEQLINDGLVEINGEFENFLRRTAGLQAQLARLREQLQGADEAVARALDDMAAAQAKITDTELMPRNHQELAETGDALLRSRRELMRERRIADAREQHERRIQTADRHREEIKLVCAQIDHEFAAAQATGKRIGAYYLRRIASYWDALVQAHPDGRHLAPRIPAIPPALPPWIEGACEDGVVTLPPAIDRSYHDIADPEARPQ